MLNYTIEKCFDELKAEIANVMEYCYNQGYLGMSLHEMEITSKLKELEEAIEDWEDTCNEQF